MGICENDNEPVGSVLQENFVFCVEMWHVLGLCDKCRFP